MSMKPQLNSSGLDSGTISPRANAHMHEIESREFKSPQQKAMENSQSVFNTSGYGRMSGAGFPAGNKTGLAGAGASIVGQSN